jgi:hypothetical protein
MQRQLHHLLTTKGCDLRPQEPFLGLEQPSPSVANRLLGLCSGTPRPGANKRSELAERMLTAAAPSECCEELADLTVRPEGGGRDRAGIRVSSKSAPRSRQGCVVSP